MNLQLVFQKQLEEDKRIYYPHTLDNIKGFQLLGNIWINLSARQWTVETYDGFVKEFTRTLTHEITHYLLATFKLILDKKGEELFCQKFAGQEFKIEF